MLSGAEGALYGAGGGLVVEAVVTFGRLHAWQQARHVSRVAGDVLPKLGAYIDPPADSLAALFRVVLGCAAGWLLHGELGGMLAAVAVGASAPAVLAQMGSATTVAEALQLGPAPGTAAEAAVAVVPASAAPPSASAAPGAPGAPAAPAASAGPTSPSPASGEAGP
ncbi:hypothetical protein B046DRAFT_06112 [Streptomyces sp. LamerLS-316]|uniref:hypothetical protein n=1 Tax=unclassified Streptomyces TaxID=2593676 RepID=UPI000823BC98|nr:MULTISPECIES: hypothetical protein [unclassified Streptomyces]MYQ39864.1 hypothetical protein [Streptomyces sp. SID4921]SCK18960.1 hypothetical protein B046DRAFT_06112 [Streptomyces sp. LamerLS-316]